MQGRKISIISMETPNGVVSRRKNVAKTLSVEVAFSPDEIALGHHGMTFVIRASIAYDKGEVTLKKCTSFEIPSELREEDFEGAVEALTK